jgi:hypothetical protein
MITMSGTTPGPRPRCTARRPCGPSRTPAADIPATSPQFHRRPVRSHTRQEFKLSDVMFIHSHYFCYERERGRTVYFILFKKKSRTISSVYLYGFGYEAGDMAGGAELDDLLHVAHVLLGVSAEHACVGVRVDGVVNPSLQQQRADDQRPTAWIRRNQNFRCLCAHAV